MYTELSNTLQHLVRHALHSNDDAELHAKINTLREKLAELRLVNTLNTLDKTGDLLETCLTLVDELATRLEILRTVVNGRQK